MNPQENNENASKSDANKNLPLDKEEYQKELLRAIEADWEVMDFEGERKELLEMYAKLYPNDELLMNFEEYSRMMDFSAFDEGAIGLYPMELPMQIDMNVALENIDNMEIFEMENLNMENLEMGNFEMGNFEMGNFEMGNLEMGNLEMGNLDMGNLENNNDLPNDNNDEYKDAELGFELNCSELVFAKGEHFPSWLASALMTDINDPIVMDDYIEN